MSLTALGFIGVYAALLVLAFTARPIYGLYAYFWAFYNNPTSRWWGSDIPEFRWSLLAAAATLVALLCAGRPTELTRPKVR